MVERQQWRSNGGEATVERHPPTLQTKDKHGDVEHVVTYSGMKTGEIIENVLM